MNSIIAGCTWATELTLLFTHSSSFVYSICLWTTCSRKWMQECWEKGHKESWLNEHNEQKKKGARRPLSRGLRGHPQYTIKLCIYLKCCFTSYAKNISTEASIRLEETHDHPQVARDFPSGAGEKASINVRGPNSSDMITIATWES